VIIIENLYFTQKMFFYVSNSKNVSSILFVVINLRYFSVLNMRMRN